MDSTENWRPLAVKQAEELAALATKSLAFTQLREAVEGRNIQKPDFIEKFLGAKETVDIKSNRWFSQTRCNCL
jgi:hypothetical protein